MVNNPPEANRAARSELESVLREMRARAQFGHMMSRLGIDVRGNCWPDSGATMSQAVRRCAACTCAELCHDWLDEDERRQRCPSFCPNAVTIDRLVGLVQAHDARARRRSDAQSGAQAPASQLAAEWSSLGPISASTRA
jgi:uncharacterized protein DUF6455